MIPNIPSTTRTKTGLSSGTVYEWQVRSACSSDSSSVSAWSSSEVFTTLIPCVKAQNPNTTNITLSEGARIGILYLEARVIGLDIKRILVLHGLLIQPIQTL